MKFEFRFQKLDVWKQSVEICRQCFEMADLLENRKRFRFAEQLRSAALSISNNIAEGSGSVSDKEFARFLDMSKKSGFEVANMLLIFNELGVCSVSEELLIFLDKECRMIASLRKSVLKS